MLNRNVNLFAFSFCIIISDAENLKEKKMEYFYNSVSLLGEFYSRLHQKTRPILIMGKSLLEILTKHVQKELTNCKNDIVHVFDVRFARLILAQVSAFS